MPANRIKIDNAVLKRYKHKAAKRPKRPIRCNILIVCEGTKTEPNYFKSFSSYNRGTFVYDITIKGIGENTINVVDKAIELRNKAQKTEQEYDRVWAVFDKDSFSDANFNSAIIKARDNNICCAWSNEAFELWYLFHFSYQETGLSREKYKKAISDFVNHSKAYKAKKPYVYEKNSDQNYHIVNKYGSQERAIKLAEAKSKEYPDEKYANHNPCTMVYKLVLQLIGKDPTLNSELSQK